MSHAAPVGETIILRRADYGRYTPASWIQEPYGTTMTDAIERLAEKQEAGKVRPHEVIEVTVVRRASISTRVDVIVDSAEGGQ